MAPMINDESWRLLFERSPIAILVIEAETQRCIDCNAAALAIHGCRSREELLGKTPIPVSASAQDDGTPSAERAAQHIAAALREGGTVFEWRYRRPDGELWDAEVHLLAFREGERQLIQLSLIDITERKASQYTAELLQRLMLDLGTSSCFEDALLRVLRTLLAASEMDSGAAYVVDSDQKRLRLAAHYGFSTEFVTRVATIPSDSPGARAAFAGEALFADSADVLGYGDEPRRLEGFRAAALLPVGSQGSLIAAFGLMSRRCDAIRPEFRRTLQVVASSAGEILHRIRADEARQRSEQALSAFTEELRSSQELLSLFVRNSPVLAYIKEVLPEGCVVLEASQTLVDLVGTTELRGKTNEQLFPPEFAAKITADDRAAVAGVTVLRLEEEFMGRSYASIKFPIQQGHRRLVAGFAIEITESKRMERELRSREAHLRAIIENQPGLVWLKDAEGHFLSVNQAFARSTGRKSADDVVGLTDYDVWPDELARSYREDDASVMAAGRAKIIEEPIADSGGTRWFETFKAPLFDDAGRVIGTTGFARDVTERRRAAEERERLIERLNQAQKLEALGVLSGGIAHDFNNLLTGVFGCIDLARAEPSAARDEYLAQALSSIERARALTHQLLTFAKGGAPVRSVQALAPLLRETVQFALSGSPVRCRFDVAADLWNAEFDPHQIAQVIDNIVINAVQSMPRGGTLEVMARNQCLRQGEHPTLPPGLYVTVSIKDQGTGISAEQLPRIFDPFYTTKPNGQGLGLATSFSIVNRHGGSIDVESAPGAGSTFRVTIPAAPGDRPKVQTSPRSSHRGGGTVLVMDDEEIVRTTLAAMLKRLGYGSVLVRDGREALAVWQAQDAVGNRLVAMIFDLTIQGGMGGKEAIQEIRRLDREIPVFVASGYADDPVMAEPAKYGFTASLSKPFSLADLSTKLDPWLKEGEPTTDATSRAP